MIYHPLYRVLGYKNEEAMVILRVLFPLKRRQSSFLLFVAAEHAIMCTCNVSIDVAEEGKKSKIQNRIGLLTMVSQDMDPSM